MRGNRRQGEQGLDAAQAGRDDRLRWQRGAAWIRSARGTEGPVGPIRGRLGLGSVAASPAEATTTDREWLDQPCDRFPRLTSDTLFRAQYGFRSGDVSEPETNRSVRPSPRHPSSSGLQSGGRQRIQHSQLDGHDRHRRRHCDRADHLWPGVGLRQDSRFGGGHWRPRGPGRVPVRAGSGDRGGRRGSHVCLRLTRPGSEGLRF